MKKTIYFIVSFVTLSVFTANAQINLITNGGFENGLNEWQNLVEGGGVATFTHETSDVNSGTGAMRAEITTIGANAWDVQSIHSGWASEVEKPYTLTFYAKADVAGTQVRIIQQNETYNARDISLTTSWQQYTWEFTAAEDNLQLKIHYFQAGTFYFDDFFIAGEGDSNEPIIAFVEPNETFQEMVGFGGAFAWYCDRITSSNRKEEMFDLFFEDLGLDILRLKNWYYPTNYPTNKTTNTMEVDWFKPHFDATIELFQAAKSYNPDVEVLLSSWGPPSFLKNNNQLNTGTLRKDNGEFMYDEYAQYWVDVLDNVGFDPDYISIQNEPGYENEDWNTCSWRPTETAEYPGFDVAIDLVYDRIKDRPYVPKMIAPETENIGNAVWDGSINTFRSMSTPLQNKDHIHAYAYHLYNFYNSPNSISNNLLNMIRDEFDNKPNFMTEFSGTNYDWLQTANIIHSTVTEAGASAYIYWEMMWDENSEQAMVKVDNNGDFEIIDQYYAVKHFSKYVNKGYKRIATSGGTSSLKIVSFLNPTADQITHVIVNRGDERNVSLNYDGYTALSAQKYVSVAGNYFQEEAQSVEDALEVPALSIVTVVVDVENDVVSNTVAYSGNSTSSEAVLFPNPADDVINIKTNSASVNWVINNSVGTELMKGSGNTIQVQDLQSGIYFITLENQERSVFRFVKR